MLRTSALIRHCCCRINCWISFVLLYFSRMWSECNRPGLSSAAHCTRHKCLIFDSFCSGKIDYLPDECFHLSLWVVCFCCFCPASNSNENILFWFFDPLEQTIMRIMRADTQLSDCWNEYEIQVFAQKTFGILANDFDWDDVCRSIDGRRLIIHLF